MTRCPPRNDKLRFKAEHQSRTTSPADDGNVSVRLSLADVGEIYLSVCQPVGTGRQPEFESHAGICLSRWKAFKTGLFLIRLAVPRYGFIANLICLMSVAGLLWLMAVGAGVMQ